MGRISPAIGQDAEREVALLADLPHRDLAVRWQTLHGAPAPKGMSRRLLLLEQIQLTSVHIQRRRNSFGIPRE